MNIKEYWTSPNNIRFIDKKDDYNEAEDEDTWDCDEDGHFPRHHDLVTECGFCKMILVRRRINGETVYVDPKELEKLEQWNTMSTNHGQDDRLTINSNLSSVDESEGI